MNATMVTLWDERPHHLECPVVTDAMAACLCNELDDYHFNKAMDARREGP